MAEAQPPRWRDRLSDARWVLVAATAFAVVLVATARISALEAALALIALVAAAAFIPRRPASSRLEISNAARLDHLREHAVMRFADTLIEPCLVLDARAIILHRNPASHRQFPTATVGNPISFSIRHPALLSAIETVRRTGLAQVVELHQSVPTETWFKVTVAPLSLPPERQAGERNLIVITMQNLTEQKRVDAMRADFIANASHEMRTPLTSLIGFIDTLLGPAARDREARERFLHIMRGQAERMSRLIDDLLSLSRIELRQHVLPTGSVGLSGLLAEVVEGLQTQAREAGVEIALSLPPTPVTVTGDREELYEVFENLIDNAIKYGAEGKKVDVSLADATGRPGFRHLVLVTDYGAGIEEEHVPRLTERFYRVDAESSRKKKGTGLGLAIVKHILNRHRGQMTIRSRPGAGTTVEILLPE